jgi:hypothetical protein
MKVKNKIYDPLNDSTDSSGFLYQKTAEYINESLLDNLKKEASEIGVEGFAWPEQKLFPIFSKEATALSAAYAKTPEQFRRIPDKVHAKIAEAMEFFDISEVIVPQRKEASYSDNEWLFPEHKKVLVETPEQVKSAEILLKEWGNDLPLMTRTYGFRRLKHRASEVKVALDSDTLPYLAEGRCHVPTMLSEISKRRDFLPHGELKLAYIHLETQLRELKLNYLDNSGECDKLASFLFDLDQQAELTDRYNKRGSLGFKDPILTVFNTTKTAGDFLNLAGNEVPIEDIASLDPEMVASIVGKEFLDDVTDDAGNIDPREMATVLNILPADMQKDIYERLLT